METKAQHAKNSINVLVACYPTCKTQYKGLTTFLYASFCCGSHLLCSWHQVRTLCHCSRHRRTNRHRHRQTNRHTYSHNASISKPCREVALIRGDPLSKTKNDTLRRCSANCVLLVCLPFCLYPCLSALQP